MYDIKKGIYRTNPPTKKPPPKKHTKNPHTQKQQTKTKNKPNKLRKVIEIEPIYKSCNICNIKSYVNHVI